MNIKTLENFINYGVNPNQTYKQLRSGSLALNLLAILGSIFGFFYNQLTYGYAIVILIVTVIFVPYLLALTFNFTQEKHIKFHAINSVNATVIFLMNCLIFMEMLEMDHVYILPICLIPLAVAGLVILISIKNIQNDRFSKPYNIKRINIGIYSSLGSIAGFWVARILLNDMSQLQAISLVAILYLFLSCVFSCGAVNFLRLYYIKKKKTQSGVGSLIDKQ